MRLVRPTAEHLRAYTAALRRGWSPNTVRGAQAAAEELALIEADAADMLRWMDDAQAQGPKITLPDGSPAQRIPSIRRWLWAEDADLPAAATSLQTTECELLYFIGVISLRWMPDHSPLPPHVLGHIGYSVVPWHSGRGHASAALAQLLPVARALGLQHVDITTDIHNRASQRVVLRNGGVLLEQFDTGAAYGRLPALRYRINL